METERWIRTFKINLDNMTCIYYIRYNYNTFSPEVDTLAIFLITVIKYLGKTVSERKGLFWLVPREV